ncbi:site-2 protease family protein [Streptomyces phyllanthi]|uniref:site-2 protease family protein n=2 Tax=Streptomyces phyllanthi TaxID=1803180 RepID=UPI003CD0706D
MGPAGDGESPATTEPSSDRRPPAPTGPEGDGASSAHTESPSDRGTAASTGPAADHGPVVPTGPEGTGERAATESAADSEPPAVTGPAADSEPPASAGPAAGHGIVGPSGHAGGGESPVATGSAGGGEPSASAGPAAGHGTPASTEPSAHHGTPTPTEPAAAPRVPARTSPSPAPASRMRRNGQEPSGTGGDRDDPERTAEVSSGGKPPRRPKEPGGGILMGRPFGVPVYVAPSWFLVAALITWVFGGQLDRVLPELGVARYLVSLFFAVAFYASVLVHELAHTIAALRFKLPVRKIQLQFFGGVSEIEKESETPGREFVLAFVGPLLSLVLAAVFYLALQGVEPGTVPGVLLAGLMISNVIVAAFNLLPGLPLDGGRMLRAVVWKITGKPMAGTVAAAWVGRALAVSVLIGLPLLTHSELLGAGTEDFGGMNTVTDALLAAILAAIIWTGAGNSLRMARLREHLPELRARSLTRRAVPVQTDTPLSEALRRANAAGARALVVVDADGEPLSLVREAAIVGVPEHRRPWVAVSGLAQELSDGMRVSAELAGEDLLDALRATPATEYLVVEESGEIFGVLSAADVERAFVKAMARPN